MLIYPRVMPCVGVMGIMFELNRVDYLSSENSGRLYGVTAGWPRWTMTLDLNNMIECDASIWRTFVRSLRGLQRGFLAYDPWRPLPLAFADGFNRTTKADGTAFAGAASGWSQQILANGDALLTLTGLPVGAKLTADDYVGFKWDAVGSAAGSYDRRTLVNLMEAGRADAAGSVTVTIEPPVPTLVPAGAIAHLDRPCCIMKISTGDTKLGRRVLDIDTEAGGKIVANQDLRP